MTAPTILQKFQEALRYHRAGELDKAELLYTVILRSEPQHGSVLHKLGLLYCQRGQLKEGAELFTRAAAASTSVGIYVDLGRARRELGDSAEALKAFSQAIAMEPKNASAHYELGLLYHVEGELEKALATYNRVVDFEPTHAEAQNNRGMVLQALDRTDEALGAYERAISLRPHFTEAYNNLGTLLQSVGRTENAIRAYRIAISRRPDFADAYFNVAKSLYSRGELEAALSAYLSAAQFKSNWPEALAEAAAMLQELGRSEEAYETCKKASELKPESLIIRWRLCLTSLRIVYRSEKEIAESRSKYSNMLHALDRDCGQLSEPALKEASKLVGSGQPFYLPYQGKEDRELQSVYGSLACRLMQARFPEFAKPLPPAASSTNGRLRIGFASGFFCRHSNWKIPIKGWIENLDRDRFELHGYHLGTRIDEDTEIASSSFTQFHARPRGVEGWARKIRSDDLHVLIYPETGMDPMSIQLAALRLAPVQATSWGHPNTSGLPTMDYFLSSELMEGDNANDHYTERLVRLSSLSISYRPPTAENIHLTRAQVGLREEAVVFWCCQSLFKYLPQYDDVLPRISASVPNAQFVFICYAHGTAVTDVLKERLDRSFSKRGIYAGNHCVFLPRMDYTRFAALARMADVFLDTIDWSGCNSLLESLQFDVPPVVLPGLLMRARHGTAIMTRMGVTEVIAKNVDEYVAIASRLARDENWRLRVRQRIAESKNKLFDDQAPVRDLETFLEAAVIGQYGSKS